MKSLEENKLSTQGMGVKKPYYSDNNFNLQEHKQNSSYSQQKYYINCLALHPKYQNTFLGGDNKGTVFVFDIDLQKTLKKSFIGNFPINTMCFSQNGSYLAIGFETGMVILTDYSNEFKFCLKIEDHFIDSSGVNARKVNTNSFHSCKFMISLKL